MTMYARLPRQGRSLLVVDLTHKCAGAVGAPFFRSVLSTLCGIPITREFDAHQCLVFQVMDVGRVTVLIRR